MHASYFEEFISVLYIILHVYTCMYIIKDEEAIFMFWYVLWSVQQHEHRNKVYILYKC